MGCAMSSSAGYWNQAQRVAARNPWRCALLLAPLLFALLATVFQPAYETNDDPTISMIASGKLFSTAPDEHLIFSHPLIGLMLKQLYTQAPNLPWYALYLLATQAVAHTVITGLLLSYRPLRQALVWLAFWLGTIGIYFITHLQFTTTAFLAGMAGVLLLWEAACRVCSRSTSQTKRISDQAVGSSNPSSPSQPVLGLLVAGSALLLWCEMIRWYMFYLIVVLPLPAIAVWWWWKKPGWRITAKAAAVVALVILGGLGMKEWHLAYYHADPEWRDFYEYNELRAQFNDTIKVVYNEQTRDSFEQAGWHEIDMQMITSWCYDDPEVFSRKKLRQIWDSRAWQAERKSLGTVLLEMKRILLVREQRLCLLLLAILTFIVPVDRRHLSFNTAVLGAAFGAILLLSIIQKTLPARVFMPIVVWAIVAIGWNLLNRSLVSSSAPPALSIWQAWQNLIQRLHAALPTFGRIRAIGRVGPVCLVIIGLGLAIKYHYNFQAQRTVAQQNIFDAFHSFQSQPSTLYVFWASSIPLENLNPLSTFEGLNEAHMLWFGWSQQMPPHRAMKARYGITNLMREWPDHPEVQVICPPICAELYAEYAKTHYAHEVRAVPTGMLMGNPIFQFQKASGDVVAQKPRTSSQVD